MNYSFSISSRNGDEYRIMLFDADISLLADTVQKSITEGANQLLTICKQLKVLEYWMSFLYLRKANKRDG